MSRILVIVTQSEMGGAQRFLLEFAPYLVSRGHKVTVVAGEGDGELFKQLQISNVKCQMYYIKSLVRKLNPLKDLFTLLKIIKIIKKEKPDVLFLQSTKAGFLGSLAAKIYKLSIVDCQLTIVYRIGGWSFHDPRARWMNKIIFLMEKTSAPLKDKIIVNSELDRQIAIEAGIVAPNKIVKIYNGIDPDKLKFLPREEARNALVSSIKYLILSKNTIVIGTVANLYATKGIEYLIEAARIVNTKYQIPQTSRFAPVQDRPNTKYIVIGEGPERLKLETLIKKYNLRDNFFLAGRLPNATQYLKAFDIFVLPSVKEGFPWVMLEAMAARLPIVATKVGAVPEIIEDGEAGLLVPPKNPEMLAEKISKLAHNANEHLIYGEKAMKKVERFSLNKMLEESEKAISNSPNF